MPELHADSQPILLLRSRKFRVERRQVATTGHETPGHETRTADFVIHPGAAVILPLLADGRILLIRNHRPAVGRTLLELPAGTLEEGEAPEVCAARELEEETGYRAERLEPLTTIYASPGFCNEQMFIYVAHGLHAGPPRLEAGEVIENEPMEYAAALQAVRTGAIVDAKTMVSLLYYDRYVHSQAGAR